MIKLIITLPDGSVLPTPEQMSEERVTVGSGVENTIVVPHDSVAESHLELLSDGHGYVIADLAGGGLTFINGHPIEPGVHYQLETGTSIQLGEVEAVYIAAEVAAVDGDQEHPEQPQFTESQEDVAAEEAFAPTVSAVPFAGVAPGGYPLPIHPAGVFVPRKPERSLWVMASVAVTFVAVAAAAAAAVLSSSISVAR